MNFDNVKKFIDIAKSEGVAELKYEEKDLKISVNFNSSYVAPQTVMSAPAAAPQVAVQNTSNNTADANDGFHTITSPFVGTFYASPAPDKPSFAKVGDRVSKGQTLCILEAMKIMNEIESDISGEIVEICVDNESLVEFGQALFKIKA